MPIGSTSPAAAVADPGWRGTGVGSVPVLFGWRTTLTGHLHADKTSLVDLLLEQTKLPGSAAYDPGPGASLEDYRRVGPQHTNTLRSEQDR